MSAGKKSLYKNTNSSTTIHSKDGAKSPRKHETNTALVEGSDIKTHLNLVTLSVLNDRKIKTV